MKNFNWYFVFALSFLPFLAFGGNVIVLASDNSGGGVGAEAVSDNIPYGCHIMLNRYLLDSPNEISGQSLPENLMDEPLFLVLYDNAFDHLVAAIPLSEQLYYPTYSDEDCKIWASTLHTTISNLYICERTTNIEDFGGYGVPWTYKTAILAGNSATNPTSFSMPSTDRSKSLLGIAADDTQNNYCVEYNHKFTPRKVRCYIVDRDPIIIGDPGNIGSIRNSDTDYIESESAQVAENNNSATFTKVFPNPFTTQINITLGDEYSKDDSVIRLYSIAGEEFFHKIIISDTKELRIDTEELPSGVYILILASTEKTKSFKIVKM